ncbi:MAG: hypothetical protein AAF707_01585 [Pseudomonadota bacterium]
MEFITEKFRTSFEGQKTYLTAMLALLIAVLGLATGETSLIDTLDMVLIALGLGSLRAGVTTEAKRAAAATETPSTVVN